MKITTRFTTTLAAASLFLSAASAAFAQITNPAIGSLGNNAEDASSGTLFTSYFIRIWQAIITVGGLAVVLFFIWGAIDWITAGGDSGKIEKARNKITQAVIGLILLVASFAIIGLISSLFFGDDFNILAPSF